MTNRVELVYDTDCPNVVGARAALRAAFAQAGLPAAWTELDRKALHRPAYVRGFGSPTILVDGADIVGVESEAEADFCRVYRDGENGFRGVPPVDQIAAALTMGEYAPASRGGGGAAPVG